MPPTPAENSPSPDPSDPTRPGSLSTFGGGFDFRGSRRLVGAEEWIWYLIAAVSYILLGIWHKWLLNWFVGPVWLVAIIVIGPWLTDRIGLTGRPLAQRAGGDGLRGPGTRVE